MDRYSEIMYIELFEYILTVILLYSNPWPVTEYFYCDAAAFTHLRDPSASSSSDMEGPWSS